MRSAAIAVMFAGLAGCAAYAPQGPGAPGTRPAIQAIVPDGMGGMVEGYQYSPAVRAGDTLHVAGFVAVLRAEESEDDPAALEAAFVRAFDAIGLVLAEAGAEWSDVVDMTTFHTDLPSQIELFAEVRARYVSEPFPAWTAIDIDRLFPDRGLVEIDVTVYLGDR